MKNQPQILNFKLSIVQILEPFLEPLEGVLGGDGIQDFVDVLSKNPVFLRGLSEAAGTLAMRHFNKGSYPEFGPTEFGSFTIHTLRIEFNGQSALLKNEFLNSVLESREFQLEASRLVLEELESLGKRIQQTAEAALAALAVHRRPAITENIFEFGQFRAA